MATQSIPRVTEEEYLRLERAAEHKHEFVDGEIVAMAGGSPVHSLLAANWIAELAPKLRGRGCHVFTSDLRVRTPLTGSFLYPDVSVVCGGPRLRQRAADILTDPRVVIEVLSPSTADYDRGKKFELYREIPELADYILVHADSPHVEHFAREPDASWIFREYRGLETSLAITSIDCIVQLADLYVGAFELPG